MNSMNYFVNLEKRFMLFYYVILLAKIVVIVGSVRSERHGIKVAKWVVTKLEKKGHQVSLVDPVELDLPLLDKMYKEMKSPP